MKPTERQVIVITGSHGFIGSVLSKGLREAGYDVWGLYRIGRALNQEIQVDMLDATQVSNALSQLPIFSVLIHTAALAHGQRPPDGESCISVNTRITDNLLQALQKRLPRLIFLSSVAVYGEDGRRGPIQVSDDLRPASEYGRSKLISEKSIMASNLKHCEILRLAPVFDEDHKIDVKKRAFLPGCPFLKIRLLPAPQHSFCHVETLVRLILKLLESPPNGLRIFNVADLEPYNQHDIIEWFPGLSIPLPVAITKPIYCLTRLVPGRKGYSMRCMYNKLFKSNVYHL
ncbi:MAG: NAD(P)-dependent oxidoreductase [Nitrospirae bacterium]|nr:NAD(P)-dependent oxidoreductase [Nitrospirota bacterium]